MITWTSRTSVFALSLGLLTGCGVSPERITNLSGQVRNLPREIFATDRTAENTAVLEVTMAFGAVTLVSPPGFCIDTRNLSDQFAMMARCDILGAPIYVDTAPLGMIAVSFADTAASPALPSPQDTATAHGLTEITDVVREDDRVFFRATGPAPIRQMAQRHWRGTAVVAGHVMGIALYGPKGGRVLSAEGLHILSAVITTAQAHHQDTL